VTKESPVTLRIRDGLALVTMDNPPVNILTPQVRVALSDVFARIVADPAVSSVVLMGAGQGFSAGTDIREIGETHSAPSVRALCDQIENCPVPVIAALHGRVVGAGAEIALAAHYRIAANGTGISLPDVTLGLVPGAGGTQRLPRLVGAVMALDILLGGRPIFAKTCKEAGLVDGIVSGDLASAGIAFSAELQRQGKGVRRSCDNKGHLLEAGPYLQAVSARRFAVSASRLHAPVRAIDCVEAALLLAFEAAMAFEEDARERCLAHWQFRALRHVFVAERRVSVDLLGREGGVRTVTDRATTTVLDPLRAALAKAGKVMVDQGVTPEDIDRAMKSLGSKEVIFGTSAAGEGGADIGPIAYRLVAVMLAEACRMAERGVVFHPTDVDALCVHSGLVSRWRGGPVQMAQEMGLLQLRDDMVAWSKDDPVWTPPAILSEAVKYARGFDALVPVKAKE
jgi:3-hydroxyacyl-CoA dehydrogenase